MAEYTALPTSLDVAGHDGFLSGVAHANAVSRFHIRRYCEIDATNADDGILLNVRGHGTGIAPHDLPHIFDRFYKGRVSDGSGLGLTIARNLVHAHRGKITAHCRINEGTTITVSLPNASADLAES